MGTDACDSIEDPQLIPESGLADPFSESANPDIIQDTIAPVSDEETNERTVNRYLLSRRLLSSSQTEMGTDACDSIENPQIIPESGLANPVSKSAKPDIIQGTITPEVTAPEPVLWQTPQFTFPTPTPVTKFPSIVSSDRIH
jgi:hypothetical protein